MGEVLVLETDLFVASEKKALQSKQSFETIIALPYLVMRSPLNNLRLFLHT
jgi:hypothetical protein